MDEDAEDLKPLTEQEIKTKLADFPDWIYKDNKLTQEFVFKSFNDALEFITELAPFFNDIDHHPDICINYKKVIFTLTRYSIGGKVTLRDFTDAAEIDRRYKEYQNS